MVNGHAPISHKVKHQDELRGITAKLIKIEKLEVRDQGVPNAHANIVTRVVHWVGLPG